MLYTTGGTALYDDYGGADTATFKCSVISDRRKIVETVSIPWSENLELHMLEDTI